jgi:hypothetical protein
MMNFVQQQEDLYNFDDQSLADELQSGRRGYNQIVVLSEIQRRTKERGEAQQQAMAQQAQQNQPVAERQLMEFMAQAQPAQASPEMAMQGGAEGMPPEMMAAAMPAAMPPEMPAEAPVGIAAGMPQQMSGGGIVRRAQMGMTPESPAQRRIRITRELNEALRSGASPERIRDLKLQLEIGGAGRMSEGALRSMGLATDPRLFQPIMRTYDVKMDQPEFDLTLPQDRQAVVPAETAAETVAETRETPTGRGVTSLPTYTPSSFDFGSQYTRNLADIALQPVTIKSQRATPESVQAASEAAKNSFFAQEMERLRKFAPDKERFQRESQSDLLVGLGSVIAGATQRGDIAKGLAQLAAQQREARRGFRGEEREFEMLKSSLRREQRADERAEEERRYQRERAEAEAERMSRAEALAITMAQAKTQTDLGQLQIAREKLRQDERQFQENLKIATTKAERDAALAGLKQTQTAIETAEAKINILAKQFEMAGLPGGLAFLRASGIDSPAISTVADIRGGR